MQMPVSDSVVSDGSRQELTGRQTMRVLSERWWRLIGMRDLEGKK